MATGIHSPTVMLGVEAYSQSSALNIPMKIGLTTRGTGTGGEVQAFSSTTLYNSAQAAASGLFQKAVGQFRDKVPDGSVAYNSTLEGTLTSYTYAQRLDYATNTSGSLSSYSGELFYIYGTVNGSGTYTPFVQSKGELRYYYVRKFFPSGAIYDANRFPLSEITPGQPTINTVSFSNNFQTATVNATLGSGSSVTTLYYARMSSGISPPSFEDPTFGAAGSAQTAPPSLTSEGGVGWQTGNTFTGLTKGEVYHFYALGWTLNNPGPRGACISPLFSVAATDERYGFQLKNASDVISLDIHDRIPRIVSVSDHTYTLASGSTGVSQGILTNLGITTDGTYIVLSEILNTELNSNWRLTTTVYSQGILVVLTKRPQTGNFIEGTTITAVYPSPVRIRVYVIRS